MRPLLLAAALAMACAGPSFAAKKGCSAPDGKPAKGEACAKAKVKVKVKTPMISQCRDVRSHLPAKCGGSNAEPVPAN